MQIPGLEVGSLSALPWRDTRTPGVLWLPLHLDEEEGGPSGRGGARRGGGVVLIRMAPGAGYEAHRHVGPEDVLVLRGGYRDELGEYVAGEHVHYAAGSSHGPVALGDASLAESASNPACVLFAVARDGIELLERGG